MNFISKLSDPVSNINLVLFRIVVGLVIFAEGSGAIALGWVKETFIDPEFNFTFIGFEFLLYLKGPWMYVHYSLIALTGILIAAGLFYRIASIAFFVLWTSAYLMQKQHYNNHYYLMVIIGLLLIMAPANKRLSLDVKYGFTGQEFYCPRWCHLIFIIQLAIVYFYGSVNKLHPDWLEGRPLTVWMNSKSQTHFLGSLLTKPYLISTLIYGGIIYDLLVVPFLLFPATRLLAVTASLVFHLFNSIVFEIGTFPYLMIGALVLFIPAGPLENVFRNENHNLGEVPRFQVSKFTTAFLLAFICLQILLPLRHWWFKGDVNWTEEGHRLSWRMMLRTKSGTIAFRIVDRDTGREWFIQPTSEGITWQQARVMAKSPDMIWQYAQYLKNKWAKQGYENCAVYASSLVSLNGRKHQPFIDPDRDLSACSWSHFSESDWILQPVKE